MSCIWGCAEGTYQFWKAALEDAFTLPPDGRGRGINLYPAEGEAGWGIENIYSQPQQVEAGQLIRDVDVHTLTRAQCAVVRRHVTEDLFYDKLKFAGVVVLSVVSTGLFIGAAFATAAVIIDITAEIFVALVLLCLESIGESILVSIVGLGGIVLLGSGSLLYEISTSLAAIVTGVVMLWSKVMIPNISRGSAYIANRNMVVRILDFGAASTARVDLPDLGGEPQSL